MKFVGEFIKKNLRGQEEPNRFGRRLFLFFPVICAEDTRYLKADAKGPGKAEDGIVAAES